MLIAGAVAAYFVLVPGKKEPPMQGQAFGSHNTSHGADQQETHKEKVHYTQQTFSPGRGRTEGEDDFDSARPLREYGEKFQPREQERKPSDEKPEGGGAVLYKGNIVPLHVKVRFGADDGKGKDDAKKKRK